MAYSLQCECGRTVAVSAAQAATQWACSCGRTIQVPALSQLRKAAGQAAYEAGVIDTIHRMVRDGELPEGQLCVVSGLPTTDSFDVYVQCESTWIKGPGQGRYVLVILMILLLPFWIIWVLVGKALLDEERRELGHNRGVSAPLRVSQQCQEQLRRSSQSQLKRFLRTVPIYAQLLNEFPRARIRV